MKLTLHRCTSIAEVPRGQMVEVAVSYPNGNSSVRWFDGITQRNATVRTKTLVPVNTSGDFSDEGRRSGDSWQELSAQRRSFARQKSMHEAHSALEALRAVAIQADEEDRAGDPLALAIARAADSMARLVANL